LRIVRDASAADDVLVEAFWRAYRGRARFDASRSFGAWMRRIASNAALDHLRRVRALPQAVADERTPGTERHDAPLAEAIGLAFAKLPPKLRVVATLALVEQESYAEIAEALELPLGTVKSRVFRATRRLRGELARLGIRS